MHEFAIYSVIPPEGCAAILWRDSGRKVEAAEALKLTAPDLLALGVIDEIVKEPIGGAHTDPDAAARLLDEALSRALAQAPLSTSSRASNSAIRSSARWDRWERWRRSMLRRSSQDQFIEQPASELLQVGLN